MLDQFSQQTNFQCLRRIQTMVELFQRSIVQFWDPRGDGSGTGTYLNGNFFDDVAKSLLTLVKGRKKVAETFT